MGRWFVEDSDGRGAGRNRRKVWRAPSGSQNIIIIIVVVVVVVVNYFIV